MGTDDYNRNSVDAVLARIEERQLSIKKSTDECVSEFRGFATEISRKIDLLEDRLEELEGYKVNITYWAAGAAFVAVIVFQMGSGIVKVLEALK